MGLGYGELFLDKEALFRYVEPPFGADREAKLRVCQSLQAIFPAFPGLAFKVWGLGCRAAWPARFRPCRDNRKWSKMAEGPKTPIPKS